MAGEEANRVPDNNDHQQPRGQNALLTMVCTAGRAVMEASNDGLRK